MHVGLTERQGLVRVISFAMINQDGSRAVLVELTVFPRLLEGDRQVRWARLFLCLWRQQLQMCCTGLQAREPATKQNPSPSANFHLALPSTNIISVGLAGHASRRDREIGFS